MHQLQRPGGHHGTAMHGSALIVEFARLRRVKHWKGLLQQIKEVDLCFSPAPTVEASCEACSIPRRTVQLPRFDTGSNSGMEADPAIICVVSNNVAAHVLGVSSLWQLPEIQLPLEEVSQLPVAGLGLGEFTVGDYMIAVPHCLSYTQLHLHAGLLHGLMEPHTVTQQQVASSRLNHRGRKTTCVVCQYG